MLIEMRKVADIKVYPQNPRRNDHAVAPVAASIQKFGFRQPLVLDEDGVIIVGSTRYKAALQMGLKEVPVHVARGLTPVQVKAYRVTDNKTAELADWDYELLVQELAQPAAVRRRSARDVLEMGLKFREIAQLEQRLAAIEAQMAGVPGLQLEQPPAHHELEDPSPLASQKGTPP